MRRHCRAIILALSAFALASCSPPQAEKARGAAETGAALPASADVQDPATLVRELYARYEHPTGEAFPPLEAQAPWSEPMRNALLAMMARSEAADEPALDFDPFIGAQDWELQNLAIGTDALAQNSHAVVRATITNAGFVEDIVYDLVWENGRWRVDNIRGRDWDLRQIATTP